MYIIDSLKSSVITIRYVELIINIEKIIRDNTILKLNIVFFLNKIL